MLKRLYVDNFRSLTNFEMRPSPVSCLVGPNGSGKSTILEVLRVIQGFLGVGRGASEVFPVFSRTRWDTRPLQRVELDVSADERLFHYELLIRHEDDRRRTVIEREAISSDGRALYEHVGGEVRLYGDDDSTEPRAKFPFDPGRSFIPVLEPRHDNKLLTAFKAWVNGVLLFALRPHEFEEDSRGEADGLATEGRNFVSWFRAIQQESPEVVERLRNSLHPVLPGLDVIRLVKQGRDSRLLQLDFADSTTPPYSLVLPELSDGQRCLFVLYAILHGLAPHASLLVFDEPDNFVARTEIQPWLAEVREAIASAGRGSLLVISHHPEVVDYLAADQTLFMWRGDSGPSRIRDLGVDRATGMTASEWLRLEEANAR